MIRQLVANAIRIKMEAKNESPLISVYEFCYAAGLSVQIMGTPDDRVEQLAKEDSFTEFKRQIQEMAKTTDAFEDCPNGERLRRLVTGCRHKGELDDDARALFAMGRADGRRLQN